MHEIDDMGEMTDDEIPTPDQLAEERRLLMDRAKMMGLRVSPNIGLETLRQKMRTALETGVRPSQQEMDKAAEASKPNDNGDNEMELPPAVRAARASLVPRKETKNEKRKRLMNEALKLVRIRLTCLNPQKRDLPGEIFTVGNKFIGTIRKYVPYNAQDQGWHVPNVIYQHLKERKFLQIQVVKSRHGTEQVKTSYVPEYGIEVLPPLTQEELRQLALQQAAAEGKVTT